MTSVLFRLEEFEEALSFSKKTLDIFREKSFNQLLAYEYLFLGNYYNNNYYQAVEIFNTVQGIQQLKSSEIREEKWNYLATYNYYKLANTGKSK